MQRYFIQNLVEAPGTSEPRLARISTGHHDVADGATIGSDPTREDQQGDREKNENERIEENDSGALHELQYNML